MDPRLNLVFDLLPNRCPTVFIAGGAAVDYDKAGDIDIFFYKTNLVAATKFLNDNRGTVLDKPNEYGNMESFLVGEIEGKADKKIQVCVSIKDSAQETVDAFDISTHSIGYLSTGEYIKGKYWTAADIHPTVHNIKKKTGERYIKICKRYGHQPSDNIIELIKMIEENLS